MMLGLRGRIALTAVAAAGTAVAVVLLAVGPGLRRRAMEHTRTELLAEARLLARIVTEATTRGASPPQLDALVDGAARDARARITVVAADGRVLADSAVSGAGLGELENHADRPEVREALSGRAGTAVRHSATVRQDLLYAAVPVVVEGRVPAVVRLARSLAGIEEEVAALRHAVALALALAFAVTALLSAALSSSLAGPIRQIMDAARRFAGGDMAARSPVTRRDELGELALILNRSADQLQERITEIARDHARTAAILSSMDDGVLAVDHRGAVMLANDTLRRNLGLGDPLGRHYLEVIRQSEVADVLESVLKSGSPSSAEAEIRVLRRVYALRAAAFPGAQGAPHGAVLTFHDVTERRKLDRIRRDFVANASHELRTPLTSIRGFVEALEDGAVNEAATSQRFLGKIRTHADRMAVLVEDLLELSRLEAGERPPRWEQVAPADLTEDVAASFAGQAAAKGIALERRDESAPAVVTDADRLRRILENLVDNAIKYTPEGGRVELGSSSAPDGGALFEVADDGPGIAAEHLPRIFERFYRVDKARSRELGGTGLGLSIVRHLAESMGATVRVESEPGRGTRFRVSVPLDGQAVPRVPLVQ